MTSATDRYVRHRELFTASSWDRLNETHVVVVGVGGLGSHVLSSIARLAPISLELWDPGILDEPDLNRQILYLESDLGARKVDAAAARLTAINRDLAIQTYALPISEAQFSAPAGRTVIFDCLDSFRDRATIGRISAQTAIPVFHGGVEGWFGQVTTLLPGGGGYERAFGPAFAESGPAAKQILPQTVAAVAAFQVGEYVHWCNASDPVIETPLSDALLLYDGRTMRTDTIALARL